MIAGRIARHLGVQFANEKEIDGRTLQTSALRLAANVARGPGSPVFAFSPTDIIPPVLTEVVKGAINLYSDRGYTIDPSDGTAKKEIGFGFFGIIDDDTAPRFESLKILAARCCNPREVTERWNEKVKEEGGSPDGCPKGSGGICVSIVMEVTDRTTGITSARDSGIRAVDITPLTRSGNSISAGPGRHLVLSEAAQKETKNGPFEIKTTLCVACALVERGQINLSIKLTDGDDNELIIFRAVDVGGLKGECCP
jgi:hypothetical protein